MQPGDTSKESRSSSINIGGNPRYISSTVTAATAANGGEFLKKMSTFLGVEQRGLNIASYLEEKLDL